MRLKTIFIAVALLWGAAANAQGLGDLLKGLGGSDSTLGNLVEGIFTKTDISLADIVGDYTSQGPAVAFKSDNLLEQAGGLAGAAALESKLKPYYEQYGLTGMTLSVDSTANFTMTVKKVKLTGDIARNDADGTFTFNIKAMGKKIGQFTAYVQKSGSDIDLMFDASKLKQLISTVGSLTGGKMTQTLSSVLDSYDGACIGFDMKCTQSQTQTQAQKDDSESNPVGTLLNRLSSKRK